jgi:spermidine synthase
MPASPLSSRQRTVVLLCFFLSGAAGLIYQVAWAKSLALIFGNTVYAVTTVLAVFMAGLALGSDWIGRWSERRNDPILLYACLELGVAVFGAASLANLAGVRAFHIYVFPALARWFFLRSALRFLAAAIVLFPPTFLMGGTLPVLVRGLGARATPLGARVSRLYWVNTLGAVVGTLAAGFWLLPRFGGRFTIAAAAFLNVLAGVIALRLRTKEPAGKGARENGATATAPDASRKMLLVVFGVVGATAMAYEIAWTRLLVTLFGSSTYAFTVMLGTFLLGIALGSALFAAWVRRGGNISIKTFAATQTLTAAAALFFLLSLSQLPELVIAVLRATGNSFNGLLLAQCLASAAAMQPVTIVFGFNFPLAVALIAEPRTQGGRESAAVGRAYAANTIGAIAGTVLAGFWLLPLVGGFRLVAITAAINLLLAFALSAREKIGTTWTGVRLAIAASLILVAASGTFYNRALATFGAELYYPMHSKGLTPAEMAETNDVLFSADGPSATVTVVRSEDYLGLKIDGKVDASNLDARTQLLLGHLGAWLHPHPRRALVIGFGSGMTLAALARNPEVEQIDCVEIEPNVIRAAPYLDSLNANVLRDPRVHIILDDARSFLATARERYDLISSEPSNPWMAGVANLYTQEFYREASARLRPGGLFVQWVQGYALEPDDLRMVFRTFATEFARVTLWRGEPSDYLLLGQIEASPLPLQRLRAMWTQPQLQDDFRKLGLDRPEGILAYHILDDADVRRFADAAPFNTDDLTLLEYRAPQSLLAEDLREKNRGLVASFRSSLLPRHLNVGDQEEALLAAGETSLELGDSERANYFVTPLEKTNPLARVLVLRGQIELAARRFGPARDALEAARKQDPHSSEARAELARAMIGLSHTDDAEKILRQVLAGDPGNLHAIDGMLELATAKKDWREAARWQAERLQINPALGCREYVRLGRDYLRAGDQAAGTHWFAKALERDAYCHPAHRTLAELAIAQKNWTEARTHLEFLVRYAPDEDASVYASLAGVRLALGDTIASREALHKGLRVFPNDPTLRRLETQNSIGTN